MMHVLTAFQLLTRAGPRGFAPRLRADTPSPRPAPLADPIGPPAPPLPGAGARRPPPPEARPALAAAPQPTA